MYISKIKIEGYRNFKNNEIEFNDGINVIIGHNNAGKSNLLKALGLVLDPNSKKRLTVSDFNMNTSWDDLKEHPPKVSITVTISKGKTSTDDDLITVSEWLTKLDNDYEATLTYQFFLPEKYKHEYLDKILQLGDPNEQISSKDLVNKAFKCINNDFIRLYTSKIWGGATSNQNQANSELLQRFDYQFLDAIRDVERDLISGRNVKLKEVLHFFLDYEIKSSDETTSDKNTKIKEKSEEFSKSSLGLIKNLDERIKSGKDAILSYAKKTGASLKSEPNFEGETSDIEMLSFLRLIIEEAGFKIPASHNGLGYNNLIYISILLAKMQANADEEYFGGNSKVFPMLIIEEPEAHLHPSMQDKFLKFLKENIQDDRVRQIFITSHSTHVTSAVELDEIICLHQDSNGNTRAGYLGKVFDNSDEGVKSKKYVKRFLDATKSNMLFAEKIILVEGIAEQLLMSILARYEDSPLEDKHVAVINVGGRYFDHFLKLFDTQKSDYAVDKQIACLTDRDPERKSENANKFNKCYPFEYKKDDKDNFKNNASVLLNTYEAHPNIRFFSQDEDKGKTFEYDLVLHNPRCQILITESMSNKNEIKEMMELDESLSIDDYLSKLRDSEENERIKRAIRSLSDVWSKEDKIKAIIASRYLNSIGKGENALELAYVLEENLPENNASFVVPDYINKAFKWIC